MEKVVRKGKSGLTKRKKDALSKMGSVGAVYSGIKKILEEARSTAYRAVNFAMVKAYWNIGRVIVEGEQKGKARSDYGIYLLDELSKRLTAEFGKGFDRTNISKMRVFYLAYPIVDALRPQLTWTHYRLLLRVEKESVRNFYIEECITNHWSTRQLERQINSFYYERLLSSKDKKPVMKESVQNSVPAHITRQFLILSFFLILHKHGVSSIFNSIQIIEY